ncbi:MAG: 3-keto-5-aminohexanoate cleavage protein, partial [Paracoccaceae bacterium]
VFDFYRKVMARLLPDSTWCAAGIGAGQRVVNEWCVETGGHTRTGLEDNVRLDRATLAPSNAALVKVATDLCDRHGRRVATWREAREILGLPLAA